MIESISLLDLKCFLSKSSVTFKRIFCYHVDFRYSQIIMCPKDQKPHPYDVQDDEALSKTQKKQMVHDLQQLSKTITAMAKSKLSQLDLPNAFLDAIEESKRITSHIARKRHFQYMGKILLKADHEAIQAQIHKIENMDGHYQIRDAVINLWIEHIVDHEKQLFNYLYQHHSHDELMQLRQGLRNHLKKPEDAAQRKKLFQLLRQLDNQNELPNPQTII